jgi:transcriptional regulator GlxA family with amidase domain/YHS domain-containing protein
MNRRDLLQMSAALGAGISLSGCSPAAARTESQPAGAAATAAQLPVPADGLIPVAVLISNGATIIDFTGPWEVFESVQPNGRGSPFQLYTVAPTPDPIVASGRMTIVPRYSIANAPAPKVVVIPAQSEPTKAVLSWVRSAAKTADIVMSVCTGAFLLAKTGLLSGKEATTHHEAYTDFATSFPDIRLQRGARFVDLGNLATAGGLSSGIDLALHVVERYFGRDVATRTAWYLEYQGQGWMDPNSNQAYAQAPRSTDEHPLCPVCQMDVDKATAPHSTYQGKSYYFCTQAHKSLFDASPERFLST